MINGTGVTATYDADPTVDVNGDNSTAAAAADTG